MHFFPRGRCDAAATTSSEMYKRTRNWENLQIANFADTCGAYGIPKMRPVYTLPDGLNWIGFNYANSTSAEERSRHGLHFYLDDYQFNRLWTHAESYLPMLKQFGAVMSPDFSVYNDFPKAIKIYNVYRNAWLACLWQLNGIVVIPTIMWGAPDTFEYCFDGFPVGGIVSVSMEGGVASDERKRTFMEGYTEMRKRLQPSGIVFHGTIPDWLDAENVICQIDTFTSKLKKRKRGDPPVLESAGKEWYNNGLEQKPEQRCDPSRCVVCGEYCRYR